MSDLISRQAVEDITWEEPSYSDPLNVLTEVREKVRALPSVENNGEWIKFKNFEEGYFHIKCSKCGQYWSIADHAKIFKYCFNCGADMRGKAE